VSETFGDKSELDAYLDIETTGLSPSSNRITVIGVALDRGRKLEHVQLYNETLHPDALLRSLAGATRLYTYNGARFDLPFIAAALGVDVPKLVPHHDLMWDCHRKGLFGGLKAVEVTLGISREVLGVGGYEAVLLWQRYEQLGGEEALATLLAYNHEDVGNLKELRRRLRAL